MHLEMSRLGVRPHVAGTLISDVRALSGIRMCEHYARVSSVNIKKF